MTEEERKIPKEIIEKLGAYFKRKRDAIYERYVFFSRDQEANETFDAYLASIRRLVSSCEFAQLEEELIRDRTVLGTRNGGVQVRMLREPSLTLDQAAMMCQNSEITQQHLQQFQKQHNEEEEVSYARRHRKNGYQARRDQTDDSDRKRDNQGRRDFRRVGDKKTSCEYCGRKEKHKSPEDCPTWGNMWKVWKEEPLCKGLETKTTTQLYQIEYSEESSSN